jgi:hypothetical protein
MSPTRRTFVRTGVLAAVSAGFALSSVRLAFGQDSQESNPSLDFQIPYEAKLNPVFSYTKATFEPYVGGIFSARGVGGQKVSLTLVNIRDPQSTVTTTRSTSLRTTRVRTPVVVKITTKWRPTDTFTLTFRASGPLSELSTIHQLEHAALGKFSLFLVHSQDAAGQNFYEAVISHTVQ